MSCRGNPKAARLCKTTIYNARMRQSSLKAFDLSLDDHLSHEYEDDPRGKNSPHATSHAGVSIQRMSRQLKVKNLDIAHKTNIGASSCRD
jgi:hypothetical protein